MIGKVARIFQRRDPQREAALALARITTLNEMKSLPWQSGVYENRRARDESGAVLGVWLVSLAEGDNGQDASFAEATRGICNNLRPGGFGIQTQLPLSADRFIVAVPVGDESEANWKFFVVNRCHKTPRRGGWHTTGLEIEMLFEPSEVQRREFADLVAAYDVVG